MVTTYIAFAGNCGTALKFYETAFNSTVKMSQPYGDYVPVGVAAPPENLSSCILHAEMEICGRCFWFADEIAQPVTKGSMVKLTAQVASA